MKEKLGGFSEKFGKFAPFVAGVVLLLSVIAGAISDSIWKLTLGGSLLDLDFLGGFLVILVAAACAATYFEKRVAFGAAGAFAILAVTDFFDVFKIIINIFKSIFEKWFSFDYLVSVVISMICNLLSFAGVAAMAALIVMVLIKPDFKFLKFWYAPAGVVLVSYLISLVFGVINDFSMLEYLSWRMPSILAVGLILLTALFNLVSLVLVPVGMALYAKYVYSDVEANQIETEL